MYDPTAFFSCQVFLFISHKAGKADWIEKCSLCSRPLKQVFLQHKNSRLYTCGIYIYSRHLKLLCVVGLQNQIILLYPSSTQHHSFLRN